MEIILAPANTIKSGDCREFNLQTANGNIQIFVVRKHENFFGYINRCPHTGVPLNWSPDQFLTTDGGFIQCGTHGALFNIDDGLCVRGPCLDQRLEEVRVLVKGGHLICEP